MEAFVEDLSNESIVGFGLNKHVLNECLVILMKVLRKIGKG